MKHTNIVKINNAYDLYRKFLTCATEIDKLLDRRSKLKEDSRESDVLARQIDSLEIELMSLRDRLKSVKVYEQSLRLLTIMTEIDSDLDKKYKLPAGSQREEQVLDSSLDRLEAEMYEIKNKLKSINIA